MLSAMHSVFWTLSIIHFSEQNTTYSTMDLFLSTNEKVGMHMYELYYKQLTSFTGPKLFIVWCTNDTSIVKPTRCTSFSNLFIFWNNTLHVSDGLSVHHQEFKTVHTATAVWHTPVAVCTVLNSWWCTERQSETCRVVFQNKINLRNRCILLVLL